MQTNTGTSTALIAETLIYAHTTSRTLMACDFSLGSVTLPVPDAGDFVELVQLHMNRAGARIAQSL
jgi:hypothetical protein